VQCFSSKGKLPTSVLQATLIRAVGVADTVPSYLTSIRRSLFYENLKNNQKLRKNFTKKQKQISHLIAPIDSSFPSRLRCLEICLFIFYVAKKFKFKLEKLFSLIDIDLFLPGFQISAYNTLIAVMLS